MRKAYSDEQVAAIVHTTLSRLQYELGETVPSQPWECETKYVQQTCIEGVRRARRGVTPEQHHEEWRIDKEADGWVYGAEKNSVRKTHPCLVPYRELPEYQKDKNRVFLFIVTALSLD
jgi:hypothetical protein